MLSLKDKRLKRGSRTVSKKCGCGELHVNRDPKLWVNVLGSEWLSKCFIEHAVKEMSIIYRELAMYKVFMSKLKESRPDIDIEAMAKEIQEDVDNLVGHNEEASEILEKEIEARKNERS